MYRFNLLTCAFVLLALQNCIQKGVPDTVIYNASIWSDGEMLDANAVAISKGQIILLGKTGDLMNTVDEHTKLIDANGMLLVPGFIDAHVHFLMGGNNLRSVKLRDAMSKQDFINRIKAFALTIPKGQWITGGDWNHENWGGELPERFWIDSVTPYNPVSLNRLDGHMILANSLAMKLSSVDNAVAHVEGGDIPRNQKNEVIGIFKDNASTLIDKNIPTASEDIEFQNLKSAMHYVASHGVTTVHHMGDFKDLALFRKYKDSLITRIYAATPLSQWYTMHEYIQEHEKGDDQLHWGMLKGFMDGSLGSHTAAMHQDFSDKKGDKGFLINPLDSIKFWIEAADAHGLQIAVHAIGDKAITDLIDIIEKANSKNGPRDRRFRIEHFQHPSFKDILRMKPLNILASMQPYHAVDDGCWAEKVLGTERIKTTYAFKSILDDSITLAFGSDWFVAPADPILGIDAAVNRNTTDGKNPGGWIPEQKISVNDALLSYTSKSAFASYDESKIGQIKNGYLADFVLLDKNVFLIPTDSIKLANVAWTMMNGKIVYEKNR